MCHNRRSVDYSPLYAFIAIVLIIIMNIASPFVSAKMSQIMLDMTMQDVEKAFGALPHPAGADLLAQQKAAGQLAGDSKACDLFYGEARRYSGDQEAVRAAYAGQLAGDGGAPRLIFVESGEISAAAQGELPGALSSLAAWGLSSAALDQPLYIVYVFLLDDKSKFPGECR